MKYKEQEVLVRDLRALADFFETKEGLSVPKPNIKIDTWISRDPVATLAQIARALPGKTEKVMSDWNYTLINRSIAPSIPVEFWTGRAAVCEKRVVGTKFVPKTKTVEIPDDLEEVEIVEWDCHPLLAN